MIISFRPRKSLAGSNTLPGGSTLSVEISRQKSNDLLIPHNQDREERLAPHKEPQSRSLLPFADFSSETNFLIKPTPSNNGDFAEQQKQQHSTDKRSSRKRRDDKNDVEESDEESRGMIYVDPFGFDEDKFHVARNNSKFRASESESGDNVVRDNNNEHTLSDRQPIASVEESYQQVVQESILHETNHANFGTGLEPLMDNDGIHDLAMKNKDLNRSIKLPDLAIHSTSNHRANNNNLVVGISPTNASGGSGGGSGGAGAGATKAKAVDMVVNDQEFDAYPSGDRLSRRPSRTLVLDEIPDVPVEDHLHEIPKLIGQASENMHNWQREDNRQSEILTVEDEESADEEEMLPATLVSPNKIDPISYQSLAAESFQGSSLKRPKEDFAPKITDSTSGQRLANIESQKQMDVAPWKSKKETGMEPVSEEDDEEEDEEEEDEEYDIQPQAKNDRKSANIGSIKSEDKGKLQRIIKEQEQIIADLTRSKLDLITNTCLQIDKLRDQIKLIDQRLALNEKQYEGSIINGKEGGAVSQSSWSWFSFGRYNNNPAPAPAPVRALAVTPLIQDIAKSKTNLANQTAHEINQLREIIKLLSKQLEKSIDKM
ncbi:hypothetical protein RFI_08639 [Reticulomyxa filosa]|uniref:Uncharacterized protein n=1 Tax=Reticulomyxa filosa TaxID=46433 RepID=X6NS01_RETFI|nr:hypothetical protein RFI_08639 [Reticulomyxa filosa]|eukprot:ETO28489.1 hypothetical protein RFI_08639 [Reticulomyxa filosa]